MRKVKTTMLLGRATAATLALSFSFGVAGGVITFSGFAPAVPPVPPIDLLPAAGLPDLDMRMVESAPLWRDPVVDDRQPLVDADRLNLRSGPVLGATPPPAIAAVRPVGTTWPAAARHSDSLARVAQHAAMAGAEKAVLKVPVPVMTTVDVSRGDTLMDLLLRAGIQRGEAHEAVTALQVVYDPRRLRAGQALEISAIDDDAGSRLTGLSFDVSFDKEVRVERAEDGAFAGVLVERPRHSQLVRRASRIDDSLYLAADRIGVPQDVTIELIKLFSWDVDFQRDLRRGDAFEMLFEEVTLEDEEGIRRGGDLLFARLTLGGQHLDAYRFERSDGTIEYYDSSGRSLRKFLLRTPVDGARISSGFGMRRHPVLGYSKMHKGTDFAAPTGTPIYAAGSGRVERANRHGGYGKYVRIRHNGEYSTAYAHLSRIASGVGPGARVRQGQVIGYVGTTGRSTGPHLHYEVLRHGAQINPLSLKHPPAAQLAGADLEAFALERGRIDRLRGELHGNTQVASKAGGAGATIR